MRLGSRGAAPRRRERQASDRQLDATSDGGTPGFSLEVISSTLAYGAGSHLRQREGHTSGPLAVTTAPQMAARRGTIVNHWSSALAYAANSHLRQRERHTSDPGGDDRTSDGGTPGDDRESFVSALAYAANSHLRQRERHTSGPWR